MDNPPISIREVADDIGISFVSCQAIFTDLSGITRAAAKIVKKVLYIYIIGHYNPSVRITA